MADDSNKKQNFASREVQAAENLIAAFNEWQSLQTEWFAQNYGTEIIDADLVGDNAHLTAADLANGFVTYAALESLLAAGHWTNLYSLTP